MIPALTDFTLMEEKKQNYLSILQTPSKEMKSQM